MCVKKKSAQLSISSSVKRLRVLEKFGDNGGDSKPYVRSITGSGGFRVSLSSDMIFALLPFGPFFWGTAS